MLFHNLILISEPALHDMIKGVAWLLGKWRSGN